MKVLLPDCRNCILSLSLVCVQTFEAFCVETFGITCNIIENYDNFNSSKNDNQVRTVV